MVREKFQKLGSDGNVVCPGLGYNSTLAAKIMKEEELKSQPKETTPIDLMISRQFLIDQGKTKKAEAAWFDRLEDELDRIETDERMIAVKQKMIEERKLQKAQSADKTIEKDE